MTTIDLSKATARTMTLSEGFKYVRTCMGLNQREFSIRIGRSPAWVSAIEREYFTTCDATVKSCASNLSVSINVDTDKIIEFLTNTNDYPKTDSVRAVPQILPPKTPTDVSHLTPNLAIRTIRLELGLSGTDVVKQCNFNSVYTSRVDTAQLRPTASAGLFAQYMEKLARYFGSKYLDPNATDTLLEMFTKSINAYYNKGGVGVDLRSSMRIDKVPPAKIISKPDLKFEHVDVTGLSFGPALKAIRTDCNIPLLEAVRAIDSNPNYLSNIENTATNVGRYITREKALEITNILSSVYGRRYSSPKAIRNIKQALVNIINKELKGVTPSSIPTPKVEETAFGLPLKDYFTSDPINKLNLKDMELGNIVRTVRNDLNIQPVKLCNVLNKSEKWLFKIEKENNVQAFRNTPDGETLLAKLCKFFADRYSIEDFDIQLNNLLREKIGMALLDVPRSTTELLQEEISVHEEPTIIGSDIDILVEEDLDYLPPIHDNHEECDIASPVLETTQVVPIPVQIPQLVSMSNEEKAELLSELMVLAKELGATITFN